MGDLLLVRHGETEWSRLGRHTGRTDVPLTPAGEQQARELAQLLARWPVTRTFCSPLARARRTAELAGLPDVRVEPALVERDYGGYEGRTYDDIRAEAPGWDAWSHDVPPGGPGCPGESIPELGDRVDALLAPLLPQIDAAAGVTVFVGHGHTLRTVAARWCGFAPEAGAVLQLDTAAVGLLGRVHARRGILGWNLLA